MSTIATRLKGPRVNIVPVSVTMLLPPTIGTARLIPGASTQAASAKYSVRRGVAAASRTATDVSGEGIDLLHYQRCAYCRAQLGAEGRRHYDDARPRPTRSSIGRQLADGRRSHSSVVASSGSPGSHALAARHARRPACGARAAVGNQIRDPP